MTTSIQRRPALSQPIVRLKVSRPPVLGRGMTGIVVSHPAHPPGTEVCTSPVLEMTQGFAATRSFIYELLTSSPP